MLSLNIKTSITGIEGYPEIKVTPLNVDSAGKASVLDILKWAKSNLIFISENVLKSEQQKGFDKTPRRLVDGVEKPIEQVKYLGKVEYIARADLFKSLYRIYEIILSQSPVRYGSYITSHFCYYNGTFVASSLDEFKRFLRAKKDFAPTDTFMFANVMPYSRMLERKGVRAGKTKPRVKTRTGHKARVYGPTLLVPNGAYYHAARLAKYELGKNLRIKFDFAVASEMAGTPFPTTTLDGKRLRHTYSPQGAFKKSAGRSYLYPTIYVRVISSGVNNE